MKQLHHVAAFALAFLMLFTATGFSVHAHSCAGELQNFAFFKQADSCPMQVQAPPSCHSEKPDKAKEPCCKDRSLQLEQHDETVEQATVQVLKPELRLVVMAYALVLPFLQKASVVLFTPDLYQHPPIARDIPVLVQSFLL